jgi:N-dimethylarginine dimethylaminohydrolase
MAKAKTINKLKTPSELDIPAIVMNFPFTLSIDDPNNVWMEESDEEIVLDHEQAYAQFMDLYNYIASSALVYLVPSTGSFQDQVYVANLGLWLPHTKEKNNIILANYKSPPRVGEEKVGNVFFRMMGYETHQPPTTWEGQADCKYLRDNIYLGGYGIRTDRKTYDWMEKKFDMNIIPIEMDDDYLYHFDCVCFPLTPEKVLLCTEVLNPSDVRKVEKVAEVIDVPVDHAYNGVTNSFRLHNTVLCATSISEYPQDHEYFEGENKKIEWLTKVCSRDALEAVFFNLHQYTHSGAMLSCMVMNLNYVSQQEQLM